MFKVLLVKKVNNKKVLIRLCKINSQILFQGALPNPVLHIIQRSIQIKVFNMRRKRNNCYNSDDGTVLGTNMDRPES